MQLLRLHRLARQFDHAVGDGKHCRVGAGECARFRQHAAKLAPDHCERALRQISEVIG